MKKSLLAFALLLGGIVPVSAFDYTNNPIEESEYRTNHSMGCMLLQECTEGIVQVTGIQDIVDYYGEYPAPPDEFHLLLDVFNKIGIKVYLAPEKYFVKNTRGIYHTVSNNFYLNDHFMKNTGHLMSVMRHEGWHAAQDCMAGTIHNNYIAVIRNDEEIPELWKEMARRTYPENAVPWEQEATWAGRTEGMTLEALRACASDTPMWDIIDPTPLTRQFLVDKGYIK